MRERERERERERDGERKGFRGKTKEFEFAKVDRPIPRSIESRSFLKVRDVAICRIEEGLKFKKIVSGAGINIVKYFF